MAPRDGEGRAARADAPRNTRRRTSLVKAVAAREVDLEPIDRLEEKVKLLVGVIDRLRADNAKASDDNARLARELDAARSRLSEAEGTSAEMTVLREERNLIRSRVDHMLKQIDSLHL
jgi:regulator of replication initiation timing